MTLLAWGQPENSITQLGYVVADLRQAMRDYGAQLNVGPWYVMEHFNGPDWRYRGEPSHLDLSIALGFAGHMNIELIQQNNAAPSVYRDCIDSGRYGFHHWAVCARDFDRSAARYRADGGTIEFEATVGGGARVAYFAMPVLPAMIEVIEVTPPVEGLFSSIYQASIDWDGSEPVRKLG